MSLIPEIYKNFYGDETRWFIGDIVSTSDPVELGRVQVRIYGVHTSSELFIPNEDLPWAQPLMPITEGGVNGLGINTGIQVGARVFGIFLDGKNSQNPMILGSLPKYEENAQGGRTTNPLARGTNTIPKPTDSVINSPASKYATQYPNNAVHQTSSGHVIEIDDTPDAERIHIYHKSGTCIEIHPNGDVVTQTKNGFKTVTGNEKLHVTGNLEIYADGNIKLQATGNVDIDGARIDLN